MRQFFLVLCSFCYFHPAFTQTVNWKKVESAARKEAAVFADHYQPTKVMLLGTFHFNYPNLDGHKIDSSKMIDVLSEKRQKEIQDVIRVIQQFNPTKIYMEAKEPRQPWIDSLYGAYLADRYQLERNEIFQLGFRAAKLLAHPKVYAVDDNNFVNENSKRYTWIDSLWSQPLPVDSTKDTRWDGLYKKVYRTSDSLTVQNTLLESFLIMADDQSLRRRQGHYLVSGFNTRDDRGPDALGMWWYDRNLRIFNNILKTAPTGKDRILVIFGAGHMPILKHLFQSSPEFEIIELKTLVKQTFK